MRRAIDATTPESEMFAPVPGWERTLDRAVLALGRTPWGESGLGRPRGIMHVFRLVERILERMRPLRPLREGGIVRFEIAPLPARAIVTRDGVVVRRGERCVILHFDNATLAALSAREPEMRRLTWQVGRIGSRDLALLAHLARQGAIPAGVRLIWAETLLYRALQRFGFTIRAAAPSVRTPFARLFLLAMLATYGRPRQLAQGGRTLEHLRLGEAWLTVEELLERFPPEAEDGREPGSG